MRGGRLPGVSLGVAGRRIWRRGWILLALLLIAAAVAACDSTNEYPIDFFPEMHYQPSFTGQQPPRLDSPASAIAFGGGNIPLGGALEPNANMVRPGPAGTPIPADVPNYTVDEAATLKNPLPNDAATQALGQQLFTVNCVVCHGADGKGDGPAAVLVFQANKAPTPANLTNPTLKSPKDNSSAQLTDGELFYVLTNGYGGYMPPFGHLLTPQERWALVVHIRHLEGK
ncbi:MAG TPA: c-type cytochrome [Thermomicrobiaceae bacterium]|nr:c-type cytochrome [Thermomicrobiaceae bacterium]